MDIYFRFFEQLGVKPDVVFSTTVTVSIFVLGYLLARANEWRIERRKRSEIRIYVREHLTSLVEPIANHTNELQRLSDSLGSATEGNIYYKEDGIRSGYLRTLPQPDLFAAIVRGTRKNRKKRINYFNDITSMLDLLERARPLWHHQLLQFEEKHREFLNEWNASLNGLVRKYEQWRIANEQTIQSLDDDAFLANFDLILGTWQRESRLNDLAHTRAHFIQPIHNLAITFSSDARINDVIPLTTQAFSAHDNIVNFKTIAREFYGEESSKLKLRGAAIQTILADPLF